MNLLIAHPRWSALTGSLFLLPFLILNAIVANRIEPIFALIRPGPHTSLQEYALLAVALMLLPMGAVVAAWPAWQRHTAGARRRLVVNAIVAVALLAIFFLLAMTLGSEIYRCDVLKIPNCD